MTVSAIDVKQLREKTGVGLMDCKKALEESSGDFEKAENILREKGISTASKKATRCTNEGKIFISLSQGKACILEVKCETDFVSSNSDFLSFGKDTAEALLQNNVEDYSKIDGFSIDQRPLKETVSNLVLKLGENIQVSRYQRLVTQGQLAAYIHMNGKIGVLVSFSGDIDPDLGKDIAMHLAALNPQYLDINDVPNDVKQKEKDIICAQLKNEGKPQNLIEKISLGKLNKFFKEVCLLEQAFVKDDKKSIKQVLPSGVVIESFIRFAL